MIRKGLSIAILERIYEQVEKYLPPGQSGFRRKRRIEIPLGRRPEIPYPTS
jgi:hypothetical protein